MWRPLYSKHEHEVKVQIPHNSVFFLIVYSTGRCDFECADRTCLPDTSLVCNGVEDCLDASDELQCTPSTIPPANSTGTSQILHLECFRLGNAFIGVCPSVHRREGWVPPVQVLSVQIMSRRRGGGLVPYLSNPAPPFPQLGLVWGWGRLGTLAKYPFLLPSPAARFSLS